MLCVNLFTHVFYYLQARLSEATESVTKKDRQPKQPYTVEKDTLLQVVDNSHAHVSLFITVCAYAADSACNKRPMPAQHCFYSILTVQHPVYFSLFAQSSNNQHTLSKTTLFKTQMCTAAPTQHMILRTTQAMCTCTCKCKQVQKHFDKRYHHHHHHRYHHHHHHSRCRLKKPTLVFVCVSFVVAVYLLMAFKTGFLSVTTRRNAGGQ